jgi:hypothetical protein
MSNPSRFAKVPPQPSTVREHHVPSIGERGNAFLRRVFLAKGPYVLADNRDRDVVGKVVAAGFVRRDYLRDNVVYLTGPGQAHLDRMMRAH